MIYTSEYSSAMLEHLVQGNGHDCLVSKAYGAAWQRSKRSLPLIVPSVVARMENNVLINDSHPDAHRITTSLHQPIWGDKRRFPDAAAFLAADAIPKRRTRRRLCP